MRVTPISPTMEALQRCRSSAWMGSGEKAGSSASEPSAWCSSPSRWPSTRSSPRKAAVQPGPGAEVLQRVAPAVGDVGDVAVHHGEGGARGPLGLERAQQGGGGPEGGLRGQEAAHLVLGVDAGLELADDLEDDLLGDHHRGVALLHLQPAHGQGRGQGHQPLGGVQPLATQLARGAGEDALLADEVEEGAQRRPRRRGHPGRPRPCSPRAAGSGPGGPARRGPPPRRG